MDLSQALKPTIGQAQPTSSPAPAPTPDDDQETSLALTRPQQEKVVACFRNERSCEEHLATCNANYDNQPTSWAWKALLFVGGALSGMLIYNNVK